MLALLVEKVAQGHQAVEHASEHSGSGTDFIIHDILARPVIKLPTVLGIDLTITNHVLMMWIVSALLIFMFKYAFRKRQQVPRGLANALEAFVLYLRDDIIVPNLGEAGKQYAPYLLTAFFFILLSNLFGLVPGGATATGNIGVTATLALFTFVMVQLAGIRKKGLVGYLRHFSPPGIPVLLNIIMIPVELISMLTKHFALAIRLFANMIAGHITVLALMSVIFFFRSWLISPFPLALIIFSSLLEILIALIQAYVFTILSAVFIGGSVAEEH
ncbi:ATP synthase F0 subunit A [candidate division KSB1 bacterium RBG_16_48_16]|nr:MAG: ATP synthase F0 subunit A [candidate division KSB1 bacterium RBG_16_48_16]